MSLVATELIADVEPTGVGRPADPYLSEARRFQPASWTRLPASDARELRRHILRHTELLKCGVQSTKNQIMPQMTRGTFASETNMTRSLRARVRASSMHSTPFSETHDMHMDPQREGRPPTCASRSRQSEPKRRAMMGPSAPRICAGTTCETRPHRWLRVPRAASSKRAESPPTKGHNLPRPRSARTPVSPDAALNLPTHAAQALATSATLYLAKPSAPPKGRLLCAPRGEEIRN